LLETRASYDVEHDRTKLNILMRCVNSSDRNFTNAKLKRRMEEIDGEKLTPLALDYRKNAKTA
jgi:hypothetical protein